MATFIARTNQVNDLTSFIWIATPQTIAANTTALCQFGGFESRDHAANGRHLGTPTGRTLGAIPNVDTSMLIAQFTASYAVTLTMEIALATPIGAFPIIVRTNVGNDHARDSVVTTLRAGSVGDTFSQKLQFTDELWAGAEVRVDITAGSTPVTLSSTNNQLTVTPLGGCFTTAPDV